MLFSKCSLNIWCYIRCITDTPISSLHKFHVETPSTHTENGLGSEVGDILCQAFTRVKWNIFSYSFILEFLKELSVVFWEGILTRREKTFLLCLNNLNKQSLCFHDWIHGMNELTSKDNTVSYCFNLVICAGPCHLSGFKKCSEDLICLWEQCAKPANVNVSFAS